MSVHITVDGEPVAGREGQTIAGVLLEAGQRTWRTAAGEERGIFCGMGICQDCVLTVNGVEGVRACQRTACEGDVVNREVRA
ncbi:(2Fe-2S)-binding protein [Microbacterium panaciterrae]|uniref:(2Fe-2S)-binding protein n=1 Tax=Microbacterium panaciterrae TaxID=985759 RepID=A0ABP8P6L1_9MICO